MKATSGMRATTRSSSNWSACDCVRLQLGTRSACIARSFSSSVGTNSWPRPVASQSDAAKIATAPSTTLQRSASATRRVGS
jgi:hypothetical protein